MGGFEGLNRIFKAYDIRGIYPSDIDEEAVRLIGNAFARYCAALGYGYPGSILVGRDMRTSSPSLAASFIEGVTGFGTDVVDVGEVSTDALYYASGVFEMPGAMFTASHNPAAYNGIKLCGPRAAPIGEDSGLSNVRGLAERFSPGEGEQGRVTKRDVLNDYAEHCRSLVNTGSFRPLRVAIDAGNGMAGKTVPEVFGPLPVEIFPLYFELDGTFPNHPADPINPDNLVDLQKAVLANGCDLGLAYDGDADRVFLVDERANLVSGSTTTAMVAQRLLRKKPDEKVIYNLICSWSVPEVIRESGGEPIRSRVGHSFIKETMAETGAIFGGEHSGHYYFRDNFRADSGMIAALIVIEALSEDERPLSELLEPLERYSASGEINSEVQDQQGVMDELQATYSDGKIDHLDGLTVEYEDWWFNCRPSNTEPLLRLNLEARTRELMEEKTAEVLAHIRGGS